jgi:hypothetical protein
VTADLKQINKSDNNVSGNQEPTTKPPVIKEQETSFENAEQFQDNSMQV